MRRLLFASLILASIATAVVAIESEPDWSKRLEVIRAEELAKLPAPKVGDRITVVRRVGGPLSGMVSEINEDSITLNRTKYSASQLTPETCDKIFPEQYVDRIARQRVYNEKYDYRARKAAKIHAQQDSAARQAQEQRVADEQVQLQREAQQRRAAAQEQIRRKQTEARAARTTATSYGIVMLIFCFLGFIIYIIPSIIAFKRGHQNAAAILALNILLGWSFIGWVAALVWSLTETSRK